MDAPDYESVITPLQALISDFLAKHIDEATLKRELPALIAAYEKFAGERAHFRLHDLTDKVHVTTLRRRAKDALDELSRDTQRRSTRVWVEQHLIVEHDPPYRDFEFFDDGGQSLFGGYAQLHETPIADGGFLYSSLAGVTKPLPFEYRALLSTLREVGGYEPAAWVYGVEVDGAIADIRDVSNWDNVYDQVHHLQQFEFPRTAEERGGCVMLLPQSRNWMLLNTVGRIFTMELHGSEAFVKEVIKRIGITATWQR